ncbi:MAG: DUF2723 domain-containing protein [Bacteroidota bacterium]
MEHKHYITWTGWGVFGVAWIVYLATMAPTASFWDCGEFIACSNELEVSHPPGAPFFVLLGRLFAMSTQDPGQVAFRVNLLSVFAGAFTALFTCWISMILAFRTLEKEAFSAVEKKWGSIIAGVVAGLCCTFADSIWWNSVEAEVYALSSFFTAIVVWLMLKWQARTNQPDHLKWIILIAYLMGLSIGVHLLNLLTLPALGLIYYFHTYKFSWKGFFLTLFLSIIALLFIQYGIIQYSFHLIWLLEKWMTGTISADGSTLTGLGFPKGTGFAIFAVLLSILLISLLVFSHLKRKITLNTIVLCITVILIGFSSYSLIFIRSNADTPIDMNNPEDINNFLSYMRREQYGDRPLVYGPMYSGQLTAIESGEMRYLEVEGETRYVEDVERKEYRYRPEDYVLFPRMYEANRYTSGPFGYINYVSDKGENPNYPLDDSPTRWEDLIFFLDYQLGHMYVRYFLWNFAGRASDIQDDSWESGFEPSALMVWNRDNKAKNHFYFLPLLLGIMGMIWQLFHQSRDLTILGFLFFCTGIAIIIYLNQYPGQPRERDYSFAGSFQTFCIWIGLGTLFCFQWLRELMGKLGLIATGVIGLIPPLLMGYQGWDDHDRTGRFIDRDFAYNLLQTCASNAILFTGGDNDTFPLWYLQEVEGIRTDVRVVNLELLISDWYVDQLRVPQNGAEPLPITITEEEYRGEAGLILYDVLPQAVSIPLNLEKIIENGVLSPEEASWAPDTMVWSFPVRGGRDNPYILRKDLLLLDLVQQVAANDWERPIYFGSMMAPDSYLGLDDFFRLEGLAYRLVPLGRSDLTPNDRYLGWVGQELLFNNLTGTYIYRGIDQPHVYLDEHIRQVIIGGSYLNSYFRLGMSYGTEAQKLRYNHAVVETASNHPSVWRDSLASQYLSVQSPTPTESIQPSEPSPIAIQREMAVELLSQNQPQLWEGISDSLSQRIEGYQQSLKDLFGYMSQVLPDTSLSYTFPDWAMLVQIYEMAGMQKELNSSLDILVTKGQNELQLILEAGGEVSPRETALSAVFMGIQYYQENGQVERAKELTEWLEEIVEGM